MKVYIAGKITGNPNYRADFGKAKKFFSSSEAWEVLNPAVLPEGMAPADYMQICLAMLFRADALLLLPNYAESPGAMLEYRLAKYIGKKVFFLEESPEFMKSWEGTV